MPHAVGRRGVGALVALLAMASLLAPWVGPVAAQVGLTLSTPFPAVAVQPGAGVDFEITISAAQRARVDLAVQGVPDGWSVSLSGGGTEVQSALVQPGAPATVTLSVDVAPEATDGTTTITVVATADGESTSLPLDLAVAQAVGGAVTLESDYPSLRGEAEQPFQFNLTLSNDTPQQLTFGLQAQGPAGWEVSIQPSGETRAASVTVDARGTQRLEVSTTPPADTPTGTYPIAVSVSGGEHQASAELAVEVTGSVAMELTTQDQRLNTTANAGSARDFEVLVVNRGSTPLTAVTLSGTGPSEWEITFEPGTLEQVAPGDAAPAVARITPSGNAVAGDYVVTLQAQSEATTEMVEVRVTVETAPIWGLVGIALIAATLGGMVWIFRRYGRR